MGEAAKEDEKEEEFIAVGPGADDLPEEKEKDAAKPEDERLAQKDDEPEEKPERHKETSKERRERAKKVRQRERAENDDLRRKNLELERRLVAMETRQASTETSAIDQRITQVTTQIATAGRVMAEALKKPNGAGADEFEEAQKIRDELRDQLAELKASKNHHAQQTEERQSAPRENDRPDPRIVRKARDWAAEHDWFQFDGDDEDSAIVRAIDVRLSQAGFDPTTDEYWEELTERVKRRLPEKFKKGAQKARHEEDDEMDDDEDDEREEREVRASGPKFSSGGRERPLKKGEVYVSAERKAAMKEYGVWDDKAARNRMLKKYAQWDAENASKR